MIELIFLVSYVVSVVLSAIIVKKYLDLSLQDYIDRYQTEQDLRRQITFLEDKIDKLVGDSQRLRSKRKNSK